jgi:hypothetical protein
MQANLMNKNLSKPNIEKMDLKMIVRGILKRVEERY